jgi:SNF2 family DNA or RNA helicase
MMNTVMQLKKVCNHPDLFYPRLVNTSLVWPLQSCYYPPLCFLPPTDLRPWLGLLVLHRELYGPSDPDQLPCDRMKTLLCVRLAEQFNETVARCSPHEVPYFRYQFSQRMKHLIYNLDLSSKRLQYSKMYGKSLSLVLKAKYPLLGIDVESRM